MCLVTVWNIWILNDLTVAFIAIAITSHNLVCQVSLSYILCICGSQPIFITPYQKRKKTQDKIFANNQHSFAKMSCICTRSLNKIPISYSVRLMQWLPIKRKLVLLLLLLSFVVAIIFCKSNSRDICIEFNEVPD